MRDWTDIINLINYLGARIDASGMPHWAKSFLVLALLFLVIYLIAVRFWTAGRVVESQITKEDVIDEYALKYQALNSSNQVKEKENPK